VTRGLSLPVAILVTGAAVLGAAGLARPSAGTTAAEAPRGGTLRVSSFADVEFVDTALAYDTTAWVVAYATCASPIPACKKR
jgi:hypothetical protein